MKSTLISSALVGLASLITSTAATGGYGGYVNPNPNTCAASSVHTTKGACQTAYGTKSVYKVPTSTKNVYQTKDATVTKYGPTGTVTVYGPNKTVTKEHTTTCTVKKHCNVKTVYATSVYTSTKIVPIVYTHTVDVTTKKTGAPYTVPTPYGFVAVGDDPANKYNKRDGGYGGYGSYNNGGYNGGAPKNYPTAVVCTATVAKTCTHAVTVAPPKVTVTKAGTTKTVNHTKSVTVTVCANPTVITSTVRSTHTVTSTKKSNVTVTKTKTVPVAGPTTYAACGANNIYSGPNGSVTVNVGKWGVKVAANSAYDCCVQCQKHNSYGSADCAGSYFVSDSKGKTCWLKLDNKCSAPSCSEYFSTAPQSYGYSSYKGTVSNGQCGRWKKH
ncbi:hypothetical protein H072_2664 [Dactylellina haptotyla CBS 200.50]|uniref:Apple domain-containing protein n=1 Tax=Dactylellina haptotyla (strain CBS 200.50) TaxID=1284197 RepID=S8AKA0_DACHA|nr:hypothetical protein H072_2664 [Dactylellina haptotyla CBS 200.50]